MKDRTSRTSLFLILFNAALLMMPALAISDKEAAPHPYVVSSEYGRFYFRMLTEHGNPSDKSQIMDYHNGSGAAYAVQLDGTDKKLWEVSGWYAFRVFLSFDGQYLVRMGNWPRGPAPSNEHLAVAFYKVGKLLKSYSTKDLIKNPEKIRPSASHYGFLSEKPGFESNAGYVFILNTVDGLKYRFDASNGKILSVE